MIYLVREQPETKWHEYVIYFFVELFKCLLKFNVTGEHKTLCNIARRGR